MDGRTGRGTVRSGLVLFVAVLVAACSSGSASPSTSAAGSEATPSEAAATASPSAEAEPVTLVVQGKESGNANGTAIEELNKVFESSHPNVTVQWTAQAPNDYDSTIQLNATGPNPPDVFQIGFGYKAMGPLVTAGAILPLDSYATQYGWDKTFGPSARAGWSFTTDGRQWGSGSLYGVAMAGEVVGVYYNKEKFDQLKLTLPNSLEDFAAALKAAKAAGELPIQYGDLDKWPGIMQVAQVINSHTTTDTVQNWIHDAQGATFANPDFVSGAQAVADWAKAGYFGTGYDGVSDADAETAFQAGKGVFYLNGSWANSTLAKGMADNLGFFLLPHVDGGSAPVTSSSNAPFVISAKSKNPDLAAEYINLMVGPQAAAIIAREGGLPLLGETVTDKPAAGTSQASIFDAFAKVWAEDRAVNFLDQSAPIGDTIMAGIQELMAGRTPAADFAAKIQKAWADYHATR
jgi:raffinose/stachyose/melibiose transport system substrate-binding protein